MQHRKNIIFLYIEIAKVTRSIFLYFPKGLESECEISKMNIEPLATHSSVANAEQSCRPAFTTFSSLVKLF